MTSLPKLAKTINDPVCGSIRVTNVFPMIQTPEFQALADKRQLSLTYLSFPSATHPRLPHVLGAYHRTRILANDWILVQKIITEEEGDALSAYALLHDIGHPAFSHVMEDLCPYDHKQRTVEIVTGMKDVVESCGVNHALLLRMLKHEHPLWAAVADKNLGTEKLDYLERDGMLTGQGRPMDLDMLRNYIYFRDGLLVIDSKAIDAAMEVQMFYMKMFKNVYLRKSLVIAQRMFKKMMHRLILAGELDPNEIFDLTDFELMAKVICSKEPLVRRFYRCMRERALFKEAIAFRPKAFAKETRIVNKPIHVFQLADREMKCITDCPALKQGAHAELEALEEKIAAEIGLPPESVLLVPVFHPDRFIPQDINVLSGDQREIYSLRAIRDDHFRAMEEMAQSYVTFRICTTKEHRARLSSPGVAENAASIVFDAAFRTAVST